MRRLLTPLLLLTLALAACQASPSTSTSQAAVLPSPSASPVTAAARTPTQANAISTGAPPGCTVVSPRPTPGPTEQSIFPPVTDKDWIKGPADASVTFIEYSDFM